MSGWYDDGSEEEAQMEARLARRQWENHQERLQLERAQEEEQQRIHEARMSAAPEMYEALKALVAVDDGIDAEDSFETATKTINDLDVAMNQARTALAKADGKP
jgi:poly-gamma-glutamate capsule biosynthesis protein CapA/YwtB (metallophosphatase superfamily)